MNTAVKKVYCKFRRVCQRFVHVETERKNKPQWLKPIGHETNITIYNPVVKSNVPLILKDRNVLRWYICGPTVYDSAHIGHAATYVKSDIIRRIMSEYFNLNVVMVMCITDVDDKIISRSLTAKRSIKDLTTHFENEFFSDMQMLNVTKPDLCCRVTDYIPQIIQFVNSIVEKGNAYIAKDGSVYFDTNKYTLYGKLSTPFSDTTHPIKKSALDFSLWKAAKQNEPFWESPWGNGRPGWHIECSTIASTVFGKSLDIHSGGIDLAFPHHENEEAQSCCYHNVDQWVNYWLHCGHLFLEGDVKMSKSLKNTISIQEFLKNYTANQFRMLCLLSNYKSGIKFSTTAMNAAVALMNKIEHFFNDCENYIAGRWSDCHVDEVSLLQLLDQTKCTVNAAVADDFDTAQAMQSLLKLVDVGNKMLHDYDNATKSRSIAAVGAVSNYVSSSLSKFGISHSTVATQPNTERLIEDFIKFRTAVRSRAMTQDTKDKVILSACDEARKDLSAHGVTIKDLKNETTWSIKKY